MIPDHFAILGCNLVHFMVHIGDISSPTGAKMAAFARPE